MKTLLLVFGFALALVLPGASYAQDDVWTKGFVWNAASNSGTEVWYGPGNKVSTNGPLANQINGLMGRGNSSVVSAASGGVNVAETGAVALRDGRVATMTATRFASTANIFKAVKALTTGGGYVGAGLVLMEAVPALLAWINGDTTGHVRVNPTSHTPEQNSACSVSPCYRWLPQYGSVYYSSQAAACVAAGPLWMAANPNVSLANVRVNPSNTALCLADGTVISGAPYVGYQYTANLSVATSSTPPVDANWLPASMDDIAPYMTPRVPDPAILGQIVAAGAPIDVTPVSVTGSAPAAPAPYVQTTTYPKPANVTTTTTAPGNPFALPNNTPTVTGSNTGSKALTGGSVAATGNAPFNSWVSPVQPGSVVTPTQATTTSTYDPTTNVTTNNTVTSQDAAKVVSTTTTATTIANTTNSSTVTNTYNTTNVTTNTTNSTPISTTTDTTKVPAPSDTPAQTDCDKYPDSVGCSKFGTPPLAEVIPKISVPVTWSNVSFAGAGSCPADIPIVIGMAHFSRTLPISFAPMCTLMTTLAPLFLALGAAAAAWLFMEGLHT